MSAAPDTRKAPTDGAPEGGGKRMAIEVGEVVIEDGNLRFLDQSMTPAYSEEISRLAVTVRGITSAPEGRAALAVHAVVGATSTLDLKGEVAALADPFFLELDGELREFPLPRTNPYFRQFFDWFLERGSLTTKVHYRIVGDQLEATNHIRVQRLGVTRDQSAGSADKKIGLPLGLIVSIVTDSRGDIEFDVPVQGKLGSPEFSFGSAVMGALKNVLVNLVTGPFRAIGKLFGRGEAVEELKVDPVTFEPGSAAITPDADRHLQQLADFLRGSPNVALTLRPVLTASDAASLKLAEVTARIQRIQREEKLADFPAAAARAFTQAFPDRALPKTADEMVEALRDREPSPDEAARRLAAGRVEVTRAALIERAGVERERLQPTDEPLTEGSGKGRVEFELKS